MRILRRFTTVLVLMLLLGLSAFADGTSTSPCAPLEPGQIETPPCAGQVQTIDPGDLSTAAPASGETQTGTFAAGESQTSFTELAASVLQSILPLF